jgi:hypothetical protein
VEINRKNNECWSLNLAFGQVSEKNLLKVKAEKNIKTINSFFSVGTILVGKSGII